MPRKIKYLIFITPIIFLVLPLPARAQFIDVVGVFGTMLEGVEEIAFPLLAAFIKLFLYLVASFSALLISGTLFSIVVDDPNWFSLSSPLVGSGWHFMVGLANMFLILILIFIAIQFILKIETFKTKKTLVNLLIVAFLINFSLLFVKMIVDVPIFAFNTFNTAAGGNTTQLILEIISPLTAVMSAAILAWGLTIIGLGVLFIIPFTAPFAQLGFVFAFPALIPFLGIAGLLIIAGFLLAGVFFSYVFLFGARAVILAIFAILSPLAFLCLILPQTKKYWNMWLKTVLEWSFLGVALLFFLVLGFKGLKFIAPSNPIDPFATVMKEGWFGAIKSWFIYYFFLFIYLLLVASVSKKLMPSAAQGLISGAQRLGGMIWATGIKPIGKAAGEEAGRGAVALKEREEAAKREKGEAYRPSVAMRVGGVMAKGVRFGHRYLAGTTPELEEIKDIEKRQAEKERKFGKDTKSAMAVFPRWKIADPHSKIAQALYLAKMEGTEGMNRLSEEQQYEVLERMKTSVPHKLVDVVKHKTELISEKEARKIDYEEAQKRKDEATLMAMREYDRAKKEGNTAVMKDLEKKAVGKRERSVPTIRQAMVPKDMEDKDVQRLVEAKIDYNEEIEKVMKETGLEKEAARQAVLITKAAFKKAADAIKDADIENLVAASFQNPEFQEAIVRFKPARFIQKVGEEKGQEYIDLIHDKFEEMAAKENGVEEIAKTNQILLRQSIAGPSFRTVFPAPEKIRKAGREKEQLKKIEEAVEKVSEEIRKGREAKKSF